MISLYSGTPGSGKSLHAAQKIYTRLTIARKPVIANFPVNRQLLFYTRRQLKKMAKNPNYRPRKRKAARFYYVSDDHLTPQFLIDYARKFHKPRKENQTLLVIDECASDTLFSNRSWQNKDRMAWLRFFQQHRKLGYTIYLIAQADKLIDKQIRCCIEYEVKHRKVNNFKLLGKIAGLLCGGSLFSATTVWYGIREKEGGELFRFKRLYEDFYDSYRDFGITSTGGTTK